MLRPALMGTALLLAACAPKPIVLIETPVVYHGGKLDPFRKTPSHRKTVETRVFYATTRAPAAGSYGNAVSHSLHLGEARVRLGPEGMQWQDLYQASLSGERTAPIPIALVEVANAGGINAESGGEGVREWTKAVQASLDESPASEIMIYVHGTKVDFANSCLLTAEIDHFAGRGFVGVGYAWPSHQSIFDYLDRVDLHRAQRSSTGLRHLIETLAANTNARQINILCYSAGGRVTSKALDELRRDHPEDSPTVLQNRYRLGTVVFAAADVPVDVFNRRLASIADMARKVIITASDKDDALIAAHRFMGGKARAGTSGTERVIEEAALRTGHANVEVIDFSHGSQDRGFDIAGHHYWYRHPWASSEVIFVMKSDAPPHRRGLSASGSEGIWALRADYPSRVLEAARREWR